MARLLRHHQASATYEGAFIFVAPFVLLLVLFPAAPLLALLFPAFALFPLLALFPGCIAGFAHCYQTESVDNSSNKPPELTCN
jgi:hypothetical protein